MPTKTGVKIRIIVLGTGQDAEEAREIAAADADVAVAAKFTKTVTHLLIDDTVKSSEARVKKAEETGVPVIKLADLKELLASGDAEPEPEAAEPEPEAAAEPEPAAVAESAAEPVPEPEPEPVELEPEDRPEAAAAAAAEEPETEPEVEAVVPAQAEAPEAERGPEIDTIEEPEAEKADAAEESPKPSPKPGLMAKLKSIFGKTDARK